jgi:hypothetical protein
MKKTYGYSPAIFKISKPTTGEKFFLIVKPPGLKKIHSKRR